MSHSPDAPPKYTNRLAKETSPYLLQHQHNPVDWFAWGPEAFEEARRLDKPIFLSVGYSTCYWCHVMERQSFENETIAAEMNRRFVNIKVDREERPDVDQLYMTAVQVQTRHGGWPMSVFLTPALEYFYGGTYFPPTDQYGRPGFLTLLRGIEDAYKNRRDDVRKTSEQFTSILGQLAEPSGPAEPITVNDAWVESLVARTVDDYEPVHGGFGSAPKFPRETVLELILVHNRYFPNERRMKMLRHALDAMAAGGIRDQLGGGFHRYSTDAKWLVPHFEIMLYDNAMLLWVYAEAFRQTGERRYEQIARGVADFVLREMTSPEGSFYTAFDAEVDAQEGLSYLWTKPEIDAVLGAEDAALFNRVYGVDQGPNFADPHHGSGVADKNILFLPRPMADAARAAGLDAEALEARLEPMRRKLKEVRGTRKQPLLDTKILTSWNALMIRGLAHAGTVLNEWRYVEAAARGAEFLLKRHRTQGGGPYRGLYRTSREGQAKYNGFLDDYAFLIQALLALADAGAQGDWRHDAAALAGEMLRRFGDHGPNTPTIEMPVGFYFTDLDATDLIVRQKVASDSPLPSGNAVAVMALLELEKLKLGKKDAARNTIGVFAAQLDANAEGMSSMVQAAALYLRGAEPFRVAATGGAGTAERPESPRETAAEVLSVVAGWSVDRSQIHLKLSIREGYHLYAYGSGGDAGLRLHPTTLTFPDGPEEAQVMYPPGEELTFAFAEQPINVYRGRMTIVAHFPSPQPRGGSLRVNLTYQACNDRACLPPVQKTFKVPVEG